MTTGTGEVSVVGAALLRDGTVLAARRSDTGGWEFPGGNVEPGETPEEALVREIDEELGCAVAVQRWLDASVDIRPGLVLRVALTRLVDGEPVARSGEHDEVRWLTADALDQVDWLPADRPFVPLIADALG